MVHKYFKGCTLLKGNEFLAAGIWLAACCNIGAMVQYQAEPLSNSEEKALLTCKSDGVIGIAEVDKRYDALQVAIEEGVREAPSNTTTYSFVAPNGETVRFTRERQVECHELESREPGYRNAIGDALFMAGSLGVPAAALVNYVRSRPSKAIKVLDL